MKPVKNRVYCYDCGRQKMLFADEKKAENFIRFHQDCDEFEKGYKPSRSYFCSVCGGWHITSKETYNEEYIPLSKQIIYATINQKMEQRNGKSILKKANSKMSEVAVFLKETPVDFDKCNRILDEAYHDIQSACDSLNKEAFMTRYLKLKNQLVKYAHSQIKMDIIAKCLKQNPIDFEKCNYMLSEVHLDILSLSDAILIKSLMNGYNCIKEQLLKHNPVQTELRKALSKNLKELEAEIKRNNSLAIVSLLELCKYQLDELDDNTLKAKYLKEYRALEVTYFAKTDPSKLILKNGAEQKIVRSICQDLMLEFDLALACKEYHICTIIIRKIVALFEVLNEAKPNTQTRIIEDWINDNLLKLSSAILASQQIQKVLCA